MKRTRIPTTTGQTERANNGTAFCIAELWNSNDRQSWDLALARYWTGGFIRPENMQLEREFDSLDVRSIEDLPAERWYEFLLQKYFRWKYTAPNRYATTTAHLKKYRSEEGFAELYRIKLELFRFDKRNINAGLRIATQINGLGLAGASGLLAVLFPDYFGTVDQFATTALQQIEDLPERAMLLRANPEALTLRLSSTMIGLMRAKATNNNHLFGTDVWTPRNIDMVLWTCGR